MGPQIIGMTRVSGGGGGDDGRTARAGGAQPETRHRQEYYAELRVAVSAEESITAKQAAAREQAAAQRWDGSVKESRWMWTEYQRKWPPEERPAVNRPGDPPGSWRGEGDKYLPAPSTTGFEAACDRVTEQEQEKDLASVARHREPRSRPPPDRLRAPPERQRPHQSESLQKYQELWPLPGAGCLPGA